MLVQDERIKRMILVLFCGCGAILAFAALSDIIHFLQGLPLTKLAKRPRIHGLLLLLPILAGLAVSLACSAWQVFSRDPAQAAFARGTSLGFMSIWALVSMFLLLVNYPIPPQAHHVDKFLIGCIILLAWSLWFNVAPFRMEQALRARVYSSFRLGLINLLVFIVLGELGVRLADPLLARGGLFSHKQTPAYLKPHSPVRGSIGVSNSQGFRDRERTLQRTSAAPRILAVGDSFTWGAGVSYDEAFVTLVEQALQAAVPGTEVMNLGVPAWGPDEELHLLRTYGIQFNPDLVLLNVFVGNDIQNKRGDDMNRPDILIVGGHSYYVHRNGNWVHDVLGPDRWYLYHDMRYLIVRARAALLKVVERATGQDDRRTNAASDMPPLVSRRQYLQAIHERSDIYRKVSTPFFEYHWKLTQATFSEIHQLLSGRGIRLVIVLLPEHVQIDRDLQEEYLAAFHQSPEDYDFLQPQRLLREWCAQNQVASLDLLQSFGSQQSPSDLYFTNDFHFSVKGHALAAATILSGLQGLLIEMGGGRIEARL